MKDESWKHDRRAIIHDAPQRWVGWEKIVSLHERACVIDIDKETNEHSLYFTTIFETGGRKGEVILLRPEQVHWNEESIKIERMEVYKRRRRFTRNVYIKIEDNPLAPIFIEFVENCDTKYLLPGYGTRFSKTIDPESHISTTHVYNRICKIDKDIWPHWLRDQRSWHLSAKIEEGGRGFDSYMLKAWFEWASMDMPAYYAGRRTEADIRRELGIKDII